MTTSNKTTCCAQCGCPLPPSGFCARCALEASSFVELEELQETGSGDELSPREKALLFGRFELLNEGEGGGKGMVYKARELRTGRIVGLKVMQGRCLREMAEVQRFQNEVRALAQLDHPHVLPIYEAGEHHGQHFYTMKWIPEGSLGHQITRWQLKDAPASDKEERQKSIATMLSQVARAIHYAHERGILHRDLKPGNILVDDRGNPYVADFGMAKFMEPGAETGLTLSGSALGTAAYMSPEQAQGHIHAITVASDVWALGVILYELLAGCRPFDGEGDLQILDKVKNQEALRPSSVLEPPSKESSRRFQAVLDPNLETICLKCLEKEPEQRYSSARVLADDLERWLRGEPILARSASPAERAWKWIKRHPVQARLVAIIVACVVVGTSAIAWQRHRLHDQARLTQQEREQGELHQAEKEFSENQAATAVSRLASLLRRNPGNHPAAERLLNALVFHSFLVPAGLPLPGNVLLSCSSPDNRLVALAGDSDASAASVGIYELDSGKRVGEYQGTNLVQALAFGADNALLAVAEAGQLRLHALRQPEGGAVIPLMADPVRQMIFLSENQLLVAAAKTAYLWQLHPPALIRSWTMAEPLVKVAYDPSSKRLAAVDESGAVQLWDPGSGRVLQNISADPPRVARYLGFSRDGSRLVCATAGAVNSARIWNVSDGSLVWELPHGAGVYDADFSPDGRRLVTAWREKTNGIAQLWDIENKKQLGNVMRHKNAVNAARFSAQGHRLVTATDDGTVQVWDATTGNPVSEPYKFDTPVLDARFINRDKRLLAWVEGKGVCQLDRTPVQRWFRLAEPAGAAPSSRLTQADRARFGTGPNPESLVGDASPDGMRVAVVALEKNVEIWDRAKRQRIGNILEHHAPVNCVRFSPGGERLVTSASDRRLRVWDARSGAPLTDWIPSEMSIPSVWFSPDSALLITGMDRLWPFCAATNDVPDWLPGLAESMAGLRFSSQGPVKLPLDTCAKLISSLAGIPAHDRLGRWIKQLRDLETGEYLDLEVSP